METEQDNPKPRKTEAILKYGILISTIGAFAFVVAGFVAWYWVHQEDKPTLSDWGNYGSYLQGTVASLWSLAGTLLIFVAFLAQKQQLLRQEIELEEQAKQFRIQHESIRLQNFENSFFQLLNQQSQIVADLQTISGNREGRNCFKGWFEQGLKYTFGNEWRKSAAGMQQRIIPDEKQYAIKCYEIFYKDYQHYLGHYFRNLYHIIKFVNEADALKADDERVEYKKRRRYTSLVRAQLSVYELCLIFYNGLSSEGVKFKPLIEKFGLLENLHDRENILMIPAHAGENYYDNKAFE